MRRAFTKRGFTGLPAWRVQRVSAVFMLLLLVFALAAFSLSPPHSYLEWRAWASSLGGSLAILVFFAALLSHMWVGLRDVLLDYAKPASRRHLLLGTVAVSLLATAVWVLFILVRLQT